MYTFRFYFSNDVVKIRRYLDAADSRKVSSGRRYCCGASIPRNPVTRLTRHSLHRANSVASEVQKSRPEDAASKASARAQKRESRFHCNSRRLTTSSLSGRTADKAVGETEIRRDLVAHKVARSNSPSLNFPLERENAKFVRRSRNYLAHAFTEK